MNVRIDIFIVSLLASHTVITYKPKESRRPSKDIRPMLGSLCMKNANILLHNTFSISLCYILVKLLIDSALTTDTEWIPCIYHSI